MKRFLAGSYSPSKTEMYLADNDLESILTPGGQVQVKDDFQRLDKPRKYKDFLRVAIVAEESAHFVQHARRELPPPWTKWEAEPASTGELKIKIADGVKIRRKSLKLIRKTMAKTFEVMEYTGNPPQRLVISKRHSIHLSSDPDFAEYDASADDGTHYTSKFPFEEDAKRVQTEVLDWWCLEKEEMEFHVKIR